jgi:uncharacterized membrane protein SpoIIM required for sporulation
MKKYKNIIIAFIVGFLASLFVVIGIKISKKKQIKKYKIEHRMENDTIHNDSTRQARMKMWKERKKHKKDSIK